MERLAWILGILLLIGCTSEKKPNAPKPSTSSQRADSLRATPAEGGDPYAMLTYSERKGKILFEKYCAVCHGKEGRGDGFNAWNLSPRPRDFTDGAYMNALSDERITETIREGGRGVNKSILMPAWGGTLTAAQIEDIVSYLRTFSRVQTNPSEVDSEQR